MSTCSRHVVSIVTYPMHRSGETVTAVRFVLVLTFFCPFLVVSLCHGDEARDSRLLRTLSGRNEQTRLRSLASINRNPSARRNAIDDLVTAAQRHAAETKRAEIVRPSTVALLYAIGRTDQPEAESLLIELLDAEHPGIAMASADVLGEFKYYGAIDYLKKQIDRPEYAESYGFRFNLVRSLALMQHPDAVDFLTQLRESLDGQLRFQLDKLLSDVTVSHFHGDQDRYEKWLATESGEEPKRESFFANADVEPDSLNRVRLGRPQYYGIDIHAKRLMFIIDHSGSMKQYWGNYTRLDRAKTELIRAINELPDNAEFAIVFYHTNVKHWRNELCSATEENKLEAIQFVRRLGYGNQTNTYGALRRSLDFDDDLEAVFLLTDGRPTTGDIVAPVSIVNDILHRNRFRHLNFNTIGIGVKGPTETFLKKLAADSNGEFREAL